MKQIENFDTYPFSGISYGGHGGSKKGILIDEKPWFLKYPKSTKSMNIEDMSYTTTPLSEYLGSKIYKMLGIDTHEVKLGIANEKLVVACKDFLKTSEVIFDYNSIKNEYEESVEQALIDLSSNSTFASENNLEEVLIVMEKNPYFKRYQELKTRFWDMFVVDAFISNHDRNEGNWGLILNKENKEVRIAPVFDNGAAFYNKTSDSRLENYLEDEIKFHQVVYDSALSIFKENGKSINPLKYIEKRHLLECNQAILRIVPKINFEDIKNLFEELPEEKNGISVLSSSQKEFYLKTLEFRYYNVLLPTYQKLRKES